MTSRLYEADDLPPELELTEIERQEIREQEELESAIAQFKGEGDVKYYVYRMKPGSRSGEWIDKFPVADYSFDELLEKLRDEYRGGQFRIDIRDKKGIMRNRQVINVEKQPDKKVPEGDDNTVSLMAMIKSMQDSTQTMIHQLAIAQKDAEMRQSESTSSMLIKMMEVMKPVEKKNGFFDDPAAILGAVTSLKELISPKDETEKMLQFLQLGKDMTNNADENVLQTAITTFGKPIADMASKINSKTTAPSQPPVGAAQSPSPVGADQSPPNPPQSPQPQTPSQTAPVTTPEPQSSTSATTVSENPMEFDPQALEYEINKMVTAAQHGRDTEFWADYIIELFGDEMAMKFIGDDKMYNLLFVQYPQAAPYKLWFDQTRTKMIEFLTESPDGVDNNVYNDSPTLESDSAHSPTSITDPDATDGSYGESFPTSNGEPTVSDSKTQDTDTL